MAKYNRLLLCIITFTTSSALFGMNTLDSAKKHLPITIKYIYYVMEPKALSEPIPKRIASKKSNRTAKNTQKIVKSSSSTPKKKNLPRSKCVIKITIDDYDQKQEPKTNLPTTNLDTIGKIYTNFSRFDDEEYDSNSDDDQAPKPETNLATTNLPPVGQTYIHFPRYAEKKYKPLSELT